MTIVRRCGHGEGLRSLAQLQTERNGRQVALSLIFHGIKGLPHQRFGKLLKFPHDWFCR